MRGKWLWIGILASLIAFSVFADENDNPCKGSYMLLSIANRPTQADSPCTVPNKRALLELGYESINGVENIKAQSFPFAQLRYGLPANSELFIFFPDYVHLSNATPSSGFSEMALGLKHELTFTDKMILTIDGSVIPSSGSRAFGSRGWGGIINGIFSYAITKSLSFTCQLGGSTQTQPVLAGGKRYSSVNPDAFFTWYPAEWLEIYAEIYGQSKTAPEQGSGFNTAVGVIYAVTHNIVIDVEGGQRIRGLLGSLENYVGAGAVILF